VLSDTPPQDERVRAAQVAMLFRSGPIGVVAAMLGAFVLAGVAPSLGGSRPLLVEIWLAVVIGVVACHLALVRAYHRGRPLAGWRVWGRRFTACSLMEGLIWGASAFYSAGPAKLDLRLLTMAVVCAVTAGAVSCFGAYMPALCALFFPAIIPFAAAPVLSGGKLPGITAGLVLLYTVGMFLVGVWHNRLLSETIELRFRNADLAQDLQAQKEAAEAASAAKSQFLAAASHDLRQPVHALGLFVAALRGQRLDAAAARLARQIEASVAAIDELFVGLLDVSRLDAGVVEPRRQTFPLQSLLDRLEHDYAVQARAKNIGLRFVASSAWLYTDPLLLERILRNLVSNAIKYTDRGRVLVGCRRGDPTRVQVWDTGRGIAAEHRQTVFQEFVQLHNPERDRAKGLGLGLAIVRRLADLLDHPLLLDSTPGRGSMFSIVVPRAEPCVLPHPATVPEPPPARRGLILVIDDETAVRQALQGLLEHWRYRVICTGSGAEMLDRIADCADRPGLIICDYRLRGDENGIAVIRRLQREYAAEIPALLVTGDTAPDRLLEASGSGLLLLHKPVAHGRLRAAIGNLMRAAREAEPTLP
jgi:signal transduction histidine kinase/CheY-like chemotaxis protein